MEEFRETFLKRADPSGSANVVQLGGVTRWLGFRLSLEELQDLVALVDTDGSGEIDFDEFLKIIRKYKEDEYKKLSKVFAKAKAARISGDNITGDELEAHEIRTHVLRELGFSKLSN